MCKIINELLKVSLSALSEKIGNFYFMDFLKASYINTQVLCLVWGVVFRVLEISAYLNWNKTMEKRCFFFLNKAMWCGIGFKTLKRHFYKLQIYKFQCEVRSPMESPLFTHLLLSPKLDKYIEGNCINCNKNLVPKLAFRKWIYHGKRIWDLICTFLVNDQNKWGWNWSWKPDHNCKWSFNPTGKKH